MGTSCHLYLTSPGGNHSLRLVQGSYDYYVLANVGEDLGEKTLAQAAAYTMSVSTQSDMERTGRLAMSAHGSFTVEGATTIPIRLIRCAAKIELSLHVSPAFTSHITLEQVQLMSAAHTATCFAENRPSDLNSYTNYTPQAVTENTFSSSFYVFENLAGENTAITDPRNKSRANAPKSATYIRIAALCQGKRVYYFIYPGSNTTTDFNLQRNGRYLISAVITGINTIDLRVSTSELTAQPWASSYKIGEIALSRLMLYCTNNPDNRFYLSYQLHKGNGTLCVNATPLPPGRGLQLLTGSGSALAEITYSQEDEGEARVGLSVTDSYGYQSYCELTTRFERLYPPELTLPTQTITMTAHTPQQLDVSFQESNYADDFTVKMEFPAHVTVAVNGESMVSNVPVTLTCGIYGLSVTATEVGAFQIYVTMTDRHGQSVSKWLRINVRPKIVTLTITPHVESTIIHISDGVSSGTQANPLLLKLSVVSSEPIPSAASFDVQVDYREGYYASTTKMTEKAVSKKNLFRLPQGHTQASTIVSSYVGYCMGTSSSARRLLRQGYYIVSQYDRVTGTSRYLISVRLNSLTPEKPSSSIRYECQTVNP